MIPGVLDHLWQSTLLALGVAALAFAFRRAAASVRYGLWLTASVKFLVPFAALAALGRYLAPAGLPPARAGPEAVLIETAAQPFSQASLQAAPFIDNPPTAPAHAAAPLVQAGPHVDARLILAALLALWAIGGLVVLVRWSIRWARVHAVVRSARPLPWPAPMPVLASDSLMEPGLVGLWRPVLVVPETLPERLTRSEVDAIVEHEATHLRRRDNLTAALHMLVEALFWFHPLVWWIGARLIEERERACDEAVIKAGHDRSAYARSLVESCRLYLQSPLSCVAGASGSDLKSRVVSIMTAPLASPLSRSRKALLLAAGSFAFATPVAAGLLISPEQRDAVAHTVVAASIAVPAHPFDPFSASAAADRGEAARAVALARAEAVLPPAPAIAGNTAAPIVVAQNVVAPPPIRIASASASTPLASAASAAASAAAPADVRAQADSFVESYAAFTKSHATARWTGPVCVRVVGLQPQQAAAVKARVEEVGMEAGIPQPAGGPPVVTGSRIAGGRSAFGPSTGNDCARNGASNIEIGFTDNPQAMLDGVMKRGTQALGDSTSPTRGVKTATLPIQAWYMTNGVTFARNGANGARSLKVDVVYQNPPGSTFSDLAPQTGGGSGYGDGAFCCEMDFGASGGAGPSTRAFHNIFVIVDVRQTDGKVLGLISDYVAMLALSQPRNLGQCNALPSVTDLFANCPGRSPPDGLTPADAAFLTALYGGDAAGSNSVTETAIAKRMAAILAKTQVASR